MVVSNGKATLYELQSVYGVEDLENIIEVIRVDSHNARVLAKREALKRER